jgi:hypothetical protein
VILRAIIIIIGILFSLSSTVRAQGWQVAPGVGTPRAANTPGTPMEKANVDIYGNQMIAPGPNASPIPADIVRRGTLTHTQPSVTTATSFTCAAANAERRYVMLQNNSGANIMINLNAGTLTGIVPTATNLGIVLVPGASYETPPNYAPTAAITCYQTSGVTINTISVVQGL